jgi:hypothetical protein
MNDDAQKKKTSLLDRLEKFSSVSKSLYAIVAGIAALIIASETQARNARFALYVISRCWIESIVIVTIWLGFLLTRKLARRLREQEKFPTFHVLRDPRVLILSLGLLGSVFTLFPPLAYIVALRYEFWTSEVRDSYARSVKSTIDGNASVGKLDSALDEANIAIDVLKGTGDEEDFSNRFAHLTAAIDRSHSLDESTTDQWNFVSERSRLFALTEAVRLDPENSNAADHLSRAVGVLSKYLQDDTRTLCSLQSIPQTFAGKALALVEARDLWSRFSSTKDCLEQVQLTVIDGWGIDNISCLIRWNSKIRSSSYQKMTGSSECATGSDFWAHDTEKDELSVSAAADSSPLAPYLGLNHPDWHPNYPTFADLLQKLVDRGMLPGTKSSSPEATTKGTKSIDEHSLPTRNDGAPNARQDSASPIPSGEPSATNAGSSSDPETNDSTSSESNSDEDQSESDSSMISIDMAEQHGISVDDLHEDVDWDSSVLWFEIPDATLKVHFKLSDPFPTQQIKFAPGVHSYQVIVRLDLKDSSKKITGKCGGKIQMSKPALHLSVALSEKSGISTCSLE